LSVEFTFNGSIIHGGVGTETAKVPEALTTTGLSFNGTAGPTGVSARAVCQNNTTSNTLQCSYNAGTALSMTQTVGSGTATMTTAAIGAGACGTTVTVSATGVATTDTITHAFNASVASNPGVLTVVSWPTAGNVNFEYCNPTAASVTPSAATLNWRVVR